MIPTDDAAVSCPLEAPVVAHEADNGHNKPAKEEVVVTAWSRYQQFVDRMETRDDQFDRKLLLEYMFRGNNLVYRQNVNPQLILNS